MCHPSKVHLRIQMIIRIFCGSKGNVLPFSYWICCFCRFLSAPNFLRSWAFTATCLASACDFSSAVRQPLTSNRRAWDFEQNLWLLFWLVQVFSHRIWHMTYPLRGVITHQFLHAQQVYSAHCKLLSTLLRHWRLLESERESKEPGNIFYSILMVSVFFSNSAWSLIYLKNFLVGVN